MIDERWRARAVLEKLEFRSGQALLKFGIVLVVAAAIAWIPAYDGLPRAGQATLFILLLAAGLWITEAIPAFAVALLVIGLEIAILGRPGGVYATGAGDWMQFVQPWASPIIWLFFGGFVLAAAAAKTGLDRWFSGLVLRRCGSRPSGVLLGTMGITFCFSMFISNTATTAMMMAVITPILLSLSSMDPFRKALLLCVPFAANIGGMGTMIGSPPNAIATGMLQSVHPVDFLQWMWIGLPPALVLAAILWVFLLKRYPSSSPELDLSAMVKSGDTAAKMPLWQRLTVMVTFVVTVVLWMSEPLHKVPTPVISFLPIVVFTVTGVIGTKEMRQLPWDVLLLLTGGLALGVAVSGTGLAEWLVGLVTTESLGPIVIALTLAYSCSVLSNFMSNTAASNILIPIGMALGEGLQIHYVVPIALAASSAMCLPVSTPPNAIAFSHGQLQSKDFLFGGLIVGIVAPAMAVFWCWLVAR